MILSTSFADRKTIARLTVQAYLEAGAISFNVETPYKFTSGWASPVYTDTRRLISFPRIRGVLMDFATSIILSEIGFEKIDAVAGGETAGISYAAWIADRLALPMQYVRKKPKGFGRNAQIEGVLTEGQRVLLVEDLNTDGRSKAKFCQALRDAGAVVEHVFVVFNYGIFKDTPKFFDSIGVELHALATWWDVLEVCKAGNHFDPKTLGEVEKFLHDPVSWSAAHGGIDQMPTD